MSSGAQGTNRNSKVLVTGGSGFVASWCIVHLLRSGAEVRATIRDLSKEADLRACLSQHADIGRLKFYAATLQNDDGWDEAMAGCDDVLHVASPMPTSNSVDEDLVGPATQGIRRVFEAAVRHRIRRLVLTSSVAAVRKSPQPWDGLADESVWTDLTQEGFDAYTHAKTIAERLAWTLAGNSPAGPELVVICPTLVVGPVIYAGTPASVRPLAQLMTRPSPALMKLGYNFIDVRDLADIHLRALTTSKSAGERFVAAGEFARFADLAPMITRGIGPDALPPLPDVPPEDTGGRRQYSSAKAVRLLGWTPRPLEVTVLDTVRSLRSAMNSDR